MSTHCEQCREVWDGEGVCRECYDKYHANPSRISIIMSEEEEAELSEEEEPKLNIWDEIEYDLWMIQSGAEMALRKLRIMRKEVSNEKNPENEP